MLRFRPQKLEVILSLNLKHFTNLKCQVILEEFPKHTTTIPCLSKDEDQDHTNLDDSQTQRANLRYERLKALQSKKAEEYPDK